MRASRTNVKRCGIRQSNPFEILATVVAKATRNATLSRWTAYQVATAYLTREVSVNPDRQRFYERVAAGAILTPQGGPDPLESFLPR